MDFRGLLRVAPEVGLDVQHDDAARGLLCALGKELEVGLISAHHRDAVDVGEVGCLLVSSGQT